MSVRTSFQRIIDDGDTAGSSWPSRVWSKRARRLSGGDLSARGDAQAGRNGSRRAKRALLKRIIASLNFAIACEEPNRARRVCLPERRRPVFEPLEPRLLLSGTTLFSTAALDSYSIKPPALMMPLTAGTAGTQSITPQTSNFGTAKSSDSLPILVDPTAVPEGNQRDYYLPRNRSRA